MAATTMLETIRTSSRRRWLAAVAGLQVLFLLVLALSYYAVGWYGQELRLKTIPIDPRDVLYGDYVTLNYEISQLKTELWNKQTEGDIPDSGTVIYVLLQKSNDNLYTAVRASRTKPKANDREVVLKGVVQYSWDESIRVKYGLERYYIPEGAGKELEKQARDMVVKVKLAPWGQVKIDGLET